MKDGSLAVASDTPSTESDSIPISHRLLGWTLQSIAVVLRNTPAWAAYGLARLLALPLLGFTLFREKRLMGKGRGMRRNLRIVFRDELTPDRERRIFRLWARHLCDTFVDFCRMPLINSSNLEQHVDTAGIARMEELAAEGNGVLAISAHTGMFESLGHTTAAFGVPAHIIVRPITNKPLSEFMDGVRTSAGVKLMNKHGILWGMKKGLEEGLVIGAMADSDVRKRPVFAPFLGTQASTNPALARLHLATGAPIVVVACHRVGRQRFRFRSFGTIRHEPTGNRDADVKAVSTRLSELVSRAILAHPEQWLWGSRRYTTRPDGEESDDDGLPPVAKGDRNRIRHAARTLDGPNS